jgi:hypothetical protein
MKNGQVEQNQGVKKYFNQKLFKIYEDMVETDFLGFLRFPRVFEKK